MNQIMTKMIKNIFILGFVLFFVSIVNIDAQMNPKIKRSDFKRVDVGFKEAWSFLKQAEKYYEAGQGTYDKALENYLKAYEYNETHAALNYKIGVCYLFTGKDRTKAVEYLRQAYELNEHITMDIHFMMGRAHHINLEFDEAINQYNTFHSSLTQHEVDWLIVDIDKYITECKHGKDLVAEPVRVILKNLGSGVNSEGDEYNQAFNSDYSTMYFTSRRSNTTGEARSGYDNKYYEDIYVTRYNNEKNEWEDAYPIEGKVNKKGNISIAGLTHGERRMYVYVGDKNEGDIMLSLITEGEWGRPKKIDKNLRSKEGEFHMCFSPDKKEFYFTSDRIEGSVGGRDIFMSKKNNDDEWTEPVNIGNIINTPHDEGRVHIDETGEVMYFSSNGHNSMGGYDVFKSVKDNQGRWTKPVNLGYPINTPRDEIFFTPGETDKEGYYATVRDNGFGGKDIYKIIILGEEKEMLLSVEDELLLWDKKPDRSLFYHVPEKVSIDTVLFMKGTVTEEKTDNPIVAKLELIDMDESRVVATTLSDKDGKYKMKIPKKKDYGIELNAQGYMFYVDTVGLQRTTFRDNTAVRNYQLAKLEVGAKVVLKNIYFDTGKSTLKTESYEELDRIVKFLKNNPSLKIEVSGHTDNIGSRSYNRKLSKSRAKSVVDYFIGHGVSADNLEYEGYAFDQPVATNATEEGRAQNRRVEFKILSK